MSLSSDCSLKLFDFSNDFLSPKLRPDQILMHEPLKNHTSFKIGGPAELLALPENTDEIQFLADACRAHQIPCMIMGNGSNLLFSDQGYRGVIIKLFKNMSKLRINLHSEISSPERIRCEAGLLLSALAAEACKAGLTGLEFASGIPGTAGGAVFMNAGAYGGEIKNVFEEAEILLPDGCVRTFSGEDMSFAYRSSVLQRNGGILLNVTLRLRAGEPAAIKAEMDDLNARRREKQPLEWPSAGSAFKRPEGLYAGQLIMDSGLRGYTVGNAQISEKHCGFIINRGGATAEDVRRLIAHVQSVVYEHFHVTLEPEIKIIGA